MKIMSRVSGFSLIEILIGVGIISALALGSITYLEKYNSSRLVDLTVKEIEAVLVDIKRRSISGEQGVAWGVRFENLGGIPHRYTLFRGLAYSTTTIERSVYLRERVKFGVPRFSDYIDIVFEPVTGDVSETKIITVIPRNNEPYVGIITVSSLGRISRTFHNSLIGYWRFDEGSGTSTSDMTGFDTVAHVAQSSPGSLLWIDDSLCKRGSCVEFNGTYFLQCDLYNKRSMNEFSVLTWAFLTSNGTSPGILTGLEGTTEWFDARFDSSRYAELRTQYSTPPNLTSPIQLSLFQWYHLGYTYDGNKKRVYVNGEEVASATLSGYSFTLDNYEIGRSGEKSSQSLYGYLDELKVYNRALKLEEIIKDFQELQ